MKTLTWMTLLLTALVLCLGVSDRGGHRCASDVSRSEAVEEAPLAGPQNDGGYGS